MSFDMLERTECSSQLRRGGVVRSRREIAQRFALAPKIGTLVTTQTRNTCSVLSPPTAVHGPP